MGNLERQQQMSIIMDKTDKIAFKLFCENHHLDHTQEQPGDEFTESFLGTYSSFENFVSYTFEEMNEVAEHVRKYIDYESMANDWEQSGDYWYETVENDCYVFDGRC
jgi:antirestriction protein